MIERDDEKRKKMKKKKNTEKKKRQKRKKRKEKKIETNKQTHRKLLFNVFDVTRCKCFHLLNILFVSESHSV